MPPVTCCRTDVIWSTEKRFRFTACPPGPWAGLCRETRPQRGPKNPEPLTPGKHYAIFGDMNQQGALAGNCARSQKGRGGRCDEADTETTFDRHADLLRCVSA